MANWRSAPAKTRSPSLKSLLTPEEVSELLYVSRNVHSDVGAGVFSVTPVPSN